MSVPIGQIWDEVLSAGRVKTQEYREKVKKIVNMAMFDLAPMAPWDALRSEITLDFSDAADSTGLWFPSEAVGIEGVWDEDDTDLEYVFRDEENMGESGDKNYRWYYSDRVGSRTTPDPLDRESKGLSVSKGASQVTIASGNALDADRTDEYIRFGDDLGYYRITSSSTSAPTIAPTYWGDGLNDVSFQVRPQGTRKVTIEGPSGTFLSTRQAIFHYWRYPTPLYDPSDLIPFPTTRALVLMGIIRHVGSGLQKEQFADRYRRELYGSDGDGGELQKMIALNPIRGRRTNQRDKRNQPMFRGTREMYKSFHNR